MRNYTTLLIIILSIITVKLSAVPATPYPIKITQPDGSEITVYLKGDEYFRYKTTLDGYLLAENDKGVLCYAKKENGRIKPSAIKASDINRRNVIEKTLLLSFERNPDLSSLSLSNRLSRISKAPAVENEANDFPLTGSPKSLVILVNFSDKNYVTENPGVAFTALLNQPGYSANGGTGSALDYFRDASNGAFTPVFDVVGPYTLPQTLAFYGTNVNEEDTNPRQMVIDACKLADDNGVNFANYDTDGDGIVDNVFIYYAGYNEAEGAPANTVWPHRWSLANLSTKFDGKSIYDYACTSELKGTSGTNMCGIGTFCHEFGHVLGLPDYYPTSSTLTHYTVRNWNIMDYGAYLNNGRTPPTYSAYDRFYLKWLVPVELKTPQNVTLPPLLSSNKAYIITQNGNHNLNGSNPSPTEFFVLENRQRTGWDAYLPASGMLVTRINYNATTWNNNTPNNDPNNMGYDIMEADGIGSSGTMAGDTYPGNYNVTTFTPTLRNGTVLNKKLSFIETAGQNISFRFMGGKYVPNIQVKGELSTFSTVHGTPSAVQKIKVYGSSLTDSIRISSLYNLHFEIQKDGDSSWKKYRALAPVDSIVDTTVINIRYNPLTPSINYTHQDQFTISSKSAESITILTAGISSRKVYITAPVAYSATDVQQNSYIANWSIVPDNEKNASGYYLTAYSISDGQSTIKQGFDNGLNSSSDWKITATSVSTTNGFSGEKIPAIIFEENNEYILSETYPAPATGVSVLLKSVTGTNGTLALEAWNGTLWTVIENIPVTSTLNETKKYSFTTDKNYTRFRFTYKKGSGALAIDDVTASFDKQIDFLCNNKWITSNTDTLYNLVPGREHFYKVKSSDKTYVTGSTTNLLYENISGYSNIIAVTTKEDTNLKKLHVSVNKNGDPIAIIPVTGKTLYIYNTIGELVKSFITTQNVINLNNLPKNQIYILKYEQRRAKIVL